MIQYLLGDTLKILETTTPARELRSGRTIIVNTVGTSMQPLLYENETQVVVAPLQRPPKKGDMLLYESRTGEPVLHRVTSVSENAVTLRGDHELLSETVPHERIAGLATEVFRHGRHYSTDGWEMRAYAAAVAGSFPLRKGVRTLMHKIAAALPQPIANAARAALRALRRKTGRDLFL